MGAANYNRNRATSTADGPRLNSLDGGWKTTMMHHPTGQPDPNRWLDEHSFESRPSPEKTQPRQLSRFKVVLLRDAANDLMFIVRTIMELTRFCRAEATHKMWESHHSGRSVLLVTYLERAELYVEQFAGRNLMTTLEPA